MSPGDSVLRLAERIEAATERIQDKDQLWHVMQEVFGEFAEQMHTWKPSRIALLVASLRRLASNINPPKED